jgi:hypothetical protein
MFPPLRGGALDQAVARHLGRHLLRAETASRVVTVAASGQRSGGSRRHLGWVPRQMPDQNVAVEERRQRRCPARSRRVRRTISSQALPMVVRSESIPGTPGDVRVRATAEATSVPLADPSSTLTPTSVSFSAMARSGTTGQSKVRMARAGTPATRVVGGTSRLTTAPAATTAPSPTVTPPRTVAPAPIQTLAPM